MDFRNESVDVRDSSAIMAEVGLGDVVEDYEEDLANRMEMGEEMEARLADTKAVKHDDAGVEVSMWNDKVVRGLKKKLEVTAEVAHACEVLRSFLGRIHKRRTTLGSAFLRGLPTPSLLPQAVVPDPSMVLFVGPVP